jgi:hypothetical protein
MSVVSHREVLMVSPPDSLPISPSVSPTILAQLDQMAARAGMGRVHASVDAALRSSPLDDEVPTFDAEDTDGNDTEHTHLIWFRAVRGPHHAAVFGFHPSPVTLSPDLEFAIARCLADSLGWQAWRELVYELPLLGAIAVMPWVLTPSLVCPVAIAALAVTAFLVRPLVMRRAVLAADVYTLHLVDRRIVRTMSDDVLAQLTGPCLSGVLARLSSPVPSRRARARHLSLALAERLGPGIDR